MDTAASPQMSGKALARARLRGRRERARSIRRRVIAFSLAAFIAAWLVIFVQLVEGKDPALSASTKHVASTSSAGTTSSGSASSSPAVTGSSGTTGSDGSSGTTSSDGSSGVTSSSSGSVSPSPVTTSQS